jgi:two-component system, OmpR family, sensor kinase
VWGWDFALEVLLRNLVVNALAHAPSGAAIAVQVSATDDGVVLCVDDAGPGIPAADRARVFDRFVRLDRSGRTPGSGLGLSIVRAVADAHGATVELLDSPLGGLRVRVLFPAAAAPGGNPGRAR